MNKNSKIFVAGHKGLVGSALVRRLEKEGCLDLILRSHAQLDLERQAEVETFFEKERPEYVFLAAAKVGGIHANSTFPAEFVYNNIAIQTNIIHSAWKTGVKRLLFLGSSCIYPRECPQPMKEEHLLTGPLEATNEPYAIAKIAGIKMCEAYNREYGTSFLAAMPTNLYGPNDNFDLENSHVLPALIRKFHLAVLAAEGKHDEIKKDERIYGSIPGNDPVIPASVTIWGSGKPFREFLHVDDLADACVFLMNLEERAFAPLVAAGRTPLINIGFGKDITIKDLAELVRKIVGFRGEMRFDSSKPDGTPKKLLDVSRMKALGWQPATSLADGIRSTFEFYLKRYEEL
ncbi:MAG: GDP-L-fucose synthase [Thermodesulfobacteriota bacterium]|nr:GDP-L-fucose synthase [Thermodesulfobacteriota bacterium]